MNVEEAEVKHAPNAKKLGHFGKMCRSKPKQQITNTKQQQSGTHHIVHVAQPQGDNNINHIQQEASDTYIFNIQSNNQLQNYPVTINNPEIMMLIDSGATHELST